MSIKGDVYLQKLKAGKRNKAIQDNGGRLFKGFVGFSGTMLAKQGG